MATTTTTMGDRTTTTARGSRSAIWWTLLGAAVLAIFIGWALSQRTTDSTIDTFPGATPSTIEQPSAPPVQPMQSPSDSVNPSSPAGPNSAP